MSPVPLLRRIAVALDLAPGSRRVLAHGLRVALDAGAELVVVHAEHDEREPDWQVAPLVAELCRLWEVPPVPVTVVRAPATAHGAHDIAAAVVHAAEVHGPDLLVVGSERRRGVELLLRASVGERIARAFSVGTLLVGRDQPGLVDPATGARSLANVLLPVGSADEAQDALDAAASFLLAVGATATVVHPLFVAPVTEPFPPLRAPAWLRVDPRRREGPVVEGVVAEAREVAADLVVMLTRRHDSLVDDLVGSRTERVQRLAPCPVLAVPYLLD